MSYSGISLDVRRYRPRWTLRWLMIGVAIICVYLGSWEITKRQVTHEVARTPSLHGSSPGPFIVVYDELDADNYRYLRRAWFSCLGYRLRLPLAWVCCEHQPLVMGGVTPRIIICAEDERSLLGMTIP